MAQKYILNKSKKLSFLVFFRPHLSVLASFLFGRSGYRRRAFRYIFARIIPVSLTQNMDSALRQAQ